MIYCSAKFQYISCYSLSQYRVCQAEWRELVSIHLMLFFIDYLLSAAKRSGSFQYISCYSLSHTLEHISGCISQFQYISCYSLSNYDSAWRHEYDVSIHLMLFFIDMECKELKPKERFNTSHVILYQRLEDGQEQKKPGFNTSHVILYPSELTQSELERSFNTSHVILYRLRFFFASRANISFNTSHVILYLALRYNTWKKFRFQYISCYSLSTSGAYSER